ncbi:MAG: hypothetical protein AAGC54_12675, partial [Cyanobacteria bacterium P01_F01_bin.4]
MDMSNPDGKSIKSVFLVVSGTLLACNGTAVAAGQETVDHDIESLLVSDANKVSEASQTEKSAAVLIAQATPITSVIPAKAEPMARFSNRQYGDTSSRQAIRIAGADIVEVQPSANTRAQFSTRADALRAQPEQSAQQLSEPEDGSEVAQVVDEDTNDADEPASYSAED